jgi:D-serine deaminase-like pyridoxal phosphate-dependent protein
MPASVESSMASAAPTPGPRPLSALATPFALIDGRVLRCNIAEMQAAVADAGAALRPHFKTHRTLALAQLQLEAGAVGLTVATVAQLGAVRRLSCPVLVSSLLQSDPSVASALREASAGPVMFSIDSERSIELLRSALGPDATAEVMIEVEAGCMRTGVAASDCGALARSAARYGFRTVGVFTYPGQSYVPDQAREAAEQELAALDSAAIALRRAGFAPRHISAGSTPTMPFARAGLPTEYRPGTYVFGDRRLVALGATAPAQLSLTVVATVVALHGNRVVLDAGGKALGRDSLPWLPGFGELAGPGTVITRLYDHHSVIEAYDGAPLSVGDRVRIVPNNSNSAMSLLRSAWLAEDRAPGEELEPVADR